MKILRIVAFMTLLILTVVGCKNEATDLNIASDSNTIWYSAPAKKWTDAFPIGNGKLAAMSFGGIETERFQLNEESLWAGTPENPYAENFREHLTKVQQLVLAGKYKEANAYGIENLTAGPTSFRSYEPLGDLLIDFDNHSQVANYKRSLDMATGVSKVTFELNGSTIVRESFISAIDNVLCIRIATTGAQKINCSIGLERQKDAEIKVLADGSIQMDGQIVDVEAPEARDENAGGSGKGGAHMRFAARLSSDVKGGNVSAEKGKLKISNATEVVLKLAAATDYNLEVLNFDASIDPSSKAEKVLAATSNKTWEGIKKAHTKEHSALFNRVSLDLGNPALDSLAMDVRLKQYKAGAEDAGLEAHLFQFGRYLLIGSSRSNSVLPANLQGKWSERMWAPWEADYHLNVNLQMNYWSADVANLSETMDPLITWFEKITEVSKPYAKEMYGSDGWFSHHASNPFGRVTPSASTISSQFNNGVLDPLPGAWMMMNLWDHYEFTQDQVFLKNQLYPMLTGASEFILDVLVEDQNGVLHFVPSSSPENQYLDPQTNEMMRITSTSTYHLTIIQAVFEATLEASAILDEGGTMKRRILEAQDKLPDFPVADNGRMMEWREDWQEKEPGHRHLSHLLGIHPFTLITEKTPKLYEAVRTSLTWREENGHGGMGWAYAHSLLMHARLLEGEKAYNSLHTLLSKGNKNSLMNTIGPFQIDGNLGATAGISEMLLQSHLKNDKGNFILHLLPAIPAQWAEGKVAGLHARGGFELDMEWNATELVVTIISEKGGSCVVRARGVEKEVTLAAGEKLELIF
ncbi:glycoside hydrolase family 95 protein [Cellulophaga sp. F20128]|uniref:glycoside hydrolase family 95 protein n=1 Tax=Cellulophaga sp. F20128 TaxID=2926413 RepID=UPI001FF1200A|nr:glycoside hydrolase family 95 protein [Cellulophaga sp. F20128]MCK0156480.1 glycoside hydrolase family 95 protein [Cellulophaga sp. F20128]